jgi:predicted nucleotidyltransferase
MKCNDRVFLSEREFATVAAVLASAAARIGAVKVFGSRATGRARPGSDLDLVVFPPSPGGALNDLRFAFEESDLPIHVDVLAWDDIESQSLRDEIGRRAVPLFADGGA